jgi:hypothetical protein
MSSRDTRCRPAAVTCRRQYLLVHVLACAILAAILDSAPAEALKLRFGGAQEWECVSEHITVPKSYVTGSFVSLEGAGLPVLGGNRASYNLRVREFTPIYTKDRG